jgi:hypothetical protein
MNHRGHHPADACFGETAFTADHAADSAHALLLYRGLARSSTAAWKEFAVAHNATNENTRAARANHPLFAAKSQRARRPLQKQFILRMIKVRHGE